MPYHDVTFCRCLVPECESLENAKYDSDWVKDVLPGTISESSGNFIPEICSKYVYMNNSTPREDETCAANWFESRQEKCSEWVFDENERTIVNDVSAAN